MEQRFWAKVRKTEDCWEWIAGKGGRGYGNFWYTGKTVNAHRFSYVLTYGEFDQSLQVCHTCDNPGCVNPEHLWLGTPKDNMQDKMKKGRHVNPQILKTHCPHGHPYSDKNTYVYKNRRHCKKCHGGYHESH